MSQGERLIEMNVLVVNDELTAPSAVGRTVRALARSLGERDMLVIEATSVEDARSVVLSDPSVQAILLSWSLGKHDTTHQGAQDLLALIRSRNSDVPVFLMADYNHWWSDQWSSTIGFSQHQQNNTDGQLGTAFRRGSYGNLNLLYYPAKNVLTGLEFVWGELEQKSGASATDYRLQFSTKVTF